MGTCKVFRVDSLFLIPLHVGNSDTEFETSLHCFKSLKREIVVRMHRYAFFLAVLWQREGAAALVAMALLARTENFVVEIKPESLCFASLTQIRR